MRLFLKAGSDVVAELGPALPLGDPDYQTWPLRTTATFGRVGSAVEECAAALEEPLHSIPPSVEAIADLEERARSAAAWVSGSPGSQRQAAAFARLDALDLHIVDEAGTTIPFAHVMVARLPAMALELPTGDGLEDLGFPDGPPFFVASARRGASWPGGTP